MPINHTTMLESNPSEQYIGWSPVIAMISEKFWIPFRGTGTGIFQKVPYHTVSFLKDTLSDTNHCQVIIY